MTADLFVVSTDSNGTRGALNTALLAALRFSERDVPTGEHLGRGYALLAPRNRPPVVFVVTVGPDAPTAVLLEKNLSAALSGVPPSITLRRKATLWLPLMGTGAGGLDARTSLEITLNVLRTSMFLWTSTFGCILLSCDGQLPVEQLGEFVAVAERRFATAGEEIAIVRDDAANFLSSDTEPPEASPADPPPPTTEATLEGSTPRKLLRHFRDDTATLTDATAAKPGLGFDHIARSIIDLVESITAQKATEHSQSREERTAAFSATVDARLTLGIFAPWGAGKSTLLRELRRQFKERAYRIVVVNPWKWDGKGDLHDYVRETVVAQLHDQNLRFLPALLKMRAWWRANSRLLWIGTILVTCTLVAGPHLPELFGDLSSPDKNSVNAWKHFLGRLGSPGLVALGLFVGRPLWNLLIGWLSKAFEQRFLGGVPTKLGADGLAQAYRDIASLILRLDGSFKPFVFFFDDIDRCSPERVAIVLDSVHSLTAAGCVVFIACDEEYVVAAINAQYEKVAKGYDAGTNFGRRFLEKIVQVSLRLPLVKSDDIFELGLAKRQRAEVGGPTTAEPASGTRETPGGLTGKVPRLEPGTSTPAPSETPIPQIQLSQIIGDLLDEAVEPLGMNIRQVKSMSNTLKLYLAIGRCGTEADARRNAAFVFADRTDPCWLDAHYHGIDAGGTPIGSIPKLASQLEEMLGEDREGMVTTYHLLGRRPMSEAQLKRALSRTSQAPAAPAPAAP